MRNYIIHTTDENLALFKGQFTNFKDCLEQAVKNRITLERADLRNKNLTNANLDDAIMPGADLSGSNLSGANLSEAYLRGSNFSGAALYNTCMNDSNISACNFADASFGATDIHGTIISDSQFSTLSCFTLDFPRTRQMSGCIFINPDGRICTMSKPPIVIRGAGNDPIILMDRHVKSGHNIIDHKHLKPLAEKLTRRVLQDRLAG